MTTDLETRMRAASESLHRSVEGLPAEAPPHRDRPPRVAAAALAVAMVTTVAVVLWNDRRGDLGTDVTTQPSDVPRLLPEGVPEGLRATGAIDLPLEGQVTSWPTSVTVYGDPDSDRPFAEADLAVLVTDGGTPDVDGDPVPVRGRQGAASEDAQFGVTVTWTEGSATQFTIASRTLDRGQVLAIADGLTVDGRNVALGPVTAGLPGPIEPVGTMADLALGSTLPVPASAAGHIVGYQAPDDMARVVTVATFAGDKSDIGVIRWMTGADHVVEVRGQSAWIGAYDSGPIAGTTRGAAESSTLRAVVWEESPGVLAVVQASGTTETALLAIAENLRSASDGEWESLIDRTAADGDTADDATGSATTATAQPGSRPPAVPDDAVVYLEGDYAGGTWAVYMNGADRLCGATAAGDAGSEVCANSQALAVTLNDNDGTLVAIFGALPQGAATVSVAGGPSPQTNEIGRGRIVYAAVIQDGRVPTDVTFYDDQGDLVSTVALDS
jgi:hypothetical protein